MRIENQKSELWEWHKIQCTAGVGYFPLSDKDNKMVVYNRWNISNLHLDPLRNSDGPFVSSLRIGNRPSIYTLVGHNASNWNRANISFKWLHIRAQWYQQRYSFFIMQCICTYCNVLKQALCYCIMSIKTDRKPVKWWETVRKQFLFLISA